MDAELLRAALEMELMQAAQDSEPSTGQTLGSAGLQAGYVSVLQHELRAGKVGTLHIFNPAAATTTNLATLCHSFLPLFFEIIE
jgi:hypothetical protein